MFPEDNSFFQETTGVHPLISISNNVVRSEQKTLVVTVDQQFEFKKGTKRQLMDRLKAKSSIAPTIKDGIV